MANAKKCDLCGRYYSADGLGVDCIRLYDSSETCKKGLPNSGRFFDVCPACSAAFVALYHSRNENPK